MKISILLLCLLSCGCSSIVTKPISFATKVAITPVKVVADTTIDTATRPLKRIPKYHFSYIPKI